MKRRERRQPDVVRGRRWLWLAKPALAVLSGATATVIAVAVLTATGLVDRGDLYRLKTRILPPEKLEIWQSDPVYGWVHRPSSVGRDRRQREYDVVYRIDEHGYRNTGGDPAAPKVVVLGGSFAFGHGVEDHQTFASLIQRGLPDYNVVNAGVAAWGTTHAWLKLAELLAGEDDVRLFLYAMITHHVPRNWLRYSWLKTLSLREDRRNPMVAIEGDRLRVRGLADPLRHGLPTSPDLERQEFDITRRLLEDMLRQCQQRDVPLLLVFLPDGSEPGSPPPLQSTFEQFANAGGYVDLRERIDYDAVRYRADGHLNPEGHRLIARELQPAVRRLLDERSFDRGPP